MAIGCYVLKTDEVKFVAIRRARKDTPQSARISIPSKYAGHRVLVTVLDDDKRGKEVVK